jgi:hypothetical protein
MKKTLLISIAIILLLGVAMCNKRTKRNINKTTLENTSTMINMTKNGITLTELVSVETFENATISLLETSSATQLDDNKIRLKFATENYELGKISNTSNTKSCANSAQGQHIHCIINNEPYTAHYTNDFVVDAKKEGMHTVLCFLSRSYHESIKNSKAFFIDNMITGKNRYAIRYANKDLSKPMLFYSRPKGEYKDAETDAVLLDFYLMNCDLSADGYKVKATINGTTFILTKWCGYFMEGLPLGKNIIELTLLDKNNNVVESLYNNVTREITLTKTK